VATRSNIVGAPSRHENMRFCAMRPGGGQGPGGALCQISAVWSRPRFALRVPLLDTFRVPKSAVLTAYAGRAANGSGQSLVTDVRFNCPIRACPHRYGHGNCSIESIAAGLAPGGGGGGGWGDGGGCGGRKRGGGWGGGGGVDAGASFGAVV